MEGNTVLNPERYNEVMSVFNSLCFGSQDIGSIINNLKKESI